MIRNLCEEYTDLLSEGEGKDGYVKKGSKVSVGGKLGHIENKRKYFGRMGETMAYKVKYEDGSISGEIDDSEFKLLEK